MATFELVTGPMRAGKTSYARFQPAATGVLSFDTLMACARNDMEMAVERIIATVAAAPHRDWVIDGWFSIYNQSAEMVRRLQASIPQAVTMTGFYAPMDGLLERAGELDPTARLYQTREHILATYRHLWRMYVHELIDMPFTFRTHKEGLISAREFSLRVRSDGAMATLEDVLGFEQYLAHQGYDTRYQTIRLPHGRIIASRDEPTGNIVDQIFQLLDVRGKTVLDCGCYHGELPFAMEDAGAARVVGVDGTPQAIETATRLKHLWGYETEFLTSSLEHYQPKACFDVVTCCNTLQYVANPSAVVQRLFAAGEVVVWETYADAFPLLDDQTTHRLMLDEESWRWRPPSPQPRYLRIYERLAA